MLVVWGSVGRDDGERGVQGSGQPILGASAPQALHVVIVPVFDLDGTLLDSDAALVEAFVVLGVAREAITFGHVVADECARLGITLDAYVAAYDIGAALPFAGVADMVRRLNRWALCSNKHGPAARAELDRLMWAPEVALFTEDFGGPKLLAPVLARLQVSPHEVVFVGDTVHDRACAQEAGVRFAVAGWNPRARHLDGDVYLAQPHEVLDLLEI